MITMLQVHTKMSKELQCDVLTDLRSMAMDMNQAVGLLEVLGVADAEERVEWYNTPALYDEDILRLANVPFVVTKCSVEGCCDVNYAGFPGDWGDFQAVYSKDELTTVEGRLNGKNVQVELCQDHFAELCKYLGDVL